MYCANCGEKLPDNAKFCSRCGERCVNTVSGQSATQPSRNAAALSARQSVSGRRLPQWQNIPRQNNSSWGFGSFLGGTALGMLFSRLFGGSHSASASVSPIHEHSNYYHDTIVHNHDDGIYHHYDDYEDHGLADGSSLDDDYDDYESCDEYDGYDGEDDD